MVYIYIFSMLQMQSMYMGKKTLIHGMNPYLTSRFGLTYSKTKTPSQTTTSWFHNDKCWSTQLNDDPQNKADQWSGLKPHKRSTIYRSCGR